MFQTLILNPAYYNEWSSVQVCTILCDPTYGINLSKEQCKVLMKENFTGDFLSLMINGLKTREAVMQHVEEFPNIENCLLSGISHWALVELVPKLFHLWNEESVKHFLGEEGEMLKGVSGEEFKELVSCVVDGSSIFCYKSKSVELSAGLKQKVWETQFIVQPFYNFLDEYQCEQEHQEKVDILKALGLTIYETSLIGEIDEILPFLELFEKSVADYEIRKKDSVSQFNEQLRKKKSENIVKDDSHIYLHPQETDENPKSYSISCSFAPTFPINKYREREVYLKKNRVLTCVEASGTGKTHFGFHLTSTDRLVIPLGTIHLCSLYKNLDKLHDSRIDMDLKAQKFVSFYYNMACLLLKYSERCSNLKGKEKSQLKQFISLFLNSNGGEWIGERDYLIYNRILPDGKENNSVWLLDEVDRIDVEMPITVLRRRAKGEGTFLTLLVSWLRLKASVVITTTHFPAIEGKIDQIISRDIGKEPLERYSYDFPLLPTLTPKQVLQFLSYFIKIPNESSVWKFVSLVLQGNIRNCEVFLQRLYLNSINSNMEGDQLILSSIDSSILENQELELVELEDFLNRSVKNIKK